jgi:hypothetical protein
MLHFCNRLEVDDENTLAYCVDAQLAPKHFPNWGEIRKSRTKIMLARCNNFQLNDIQLNNIQHNDIQRNDTQHKDIQHNNKSIAMPSIMALLRVFLC